MHKCIYIVKARIAGDIRAPIALAPEAPCAPRRARGCRGATTVELALVTPLLLAVLVGLIDLGIGVFAYNTLAEAVRAGTRYAAVHGSKASNQVGPSSNDTSVETVVRQYAAGIQASRLTITSSWPDGGNDAGDRVVVTATYNYAPTVTWVLGTRTFQLSARSAMVITH